MFAEYQFSRFSNSIGGVMVSVLVSTAGDREFASPVGQA